VTWTAPSSTLENSTGEEFTTSWDDQGGNYVVTATCGVSKTAKVSIVEVIGAASQKSSLSFGHSNLTKAIVNPLQDTEGNYLCAHAAGVWEVRFKGLNDETFGGWNELAGNAPQITITQGSLGWYEYRVRDFYKDNFYSLGQYIRAEYSLSISDTSLCVNESKTVGTLTTTPPVNVPLSVGMKNLEDNSDEEFSSNPHSVISFGNSEIIGHSIINQLILTNHSVGNGTIKFILDDTNNLLPCEEEVEILPPNVFFTADISVAEVGQITANKTIISKDPNEVIQMQALPAPSGALSCIQWERRVNNGDWMSVPGGIYLQLHGSEEAGSYQYRARNGINGAWRESPVLKIVGLNSVTGVKSAPNSGAVLDGSFLCKNQSASIDFTVTTNPISVPQTFTEENITWTVTPTSAGSFSDDSGTTAVWVQANEFVSSAEHDVVIKATCGTNVSEFKLTIISAVGSTIYGTAGSIGVTGENSLVTPVPPLSSDAAVQELADTLSGMPLEAWVLSLHEGYSGNLPLITDLANSISVVPATSDPLKLKFTVDLKPEAEAGDYDLKPISTVLYGEHGEHLVVIDVDLMVDSNNDGSIDSEDDAIEDSGEEEGVAVMWNRNDDDDNGSPDYEVNYIINEEDMKDLVDLKIKAKGINERLFLKIEPTGFLRIYANDESEVLSPENSNEIDISSYVALSTEDELTFKIEGVEVGSSNIELILKNSDGSISSNDKVRVNVVDVQVGVSSRSENFDPANYYYAWRTKYEFGNIESQEWTYRTKSVGGTWSSFASLPNDGNLSDYFQVGDLYSGDLAHQAEYKCVVTKNGKKYEHSIVAKLYTDYDFLTYDDLMSKPSLMVMSKASSKPTNGERVIDEVTGESYLRVAQQASVRIPLADGKSEARFVDWNGTWYRPASTFEVNGKKANYYTLESSTALTAAERAYFENIISNPLGLPDGEWGSWAVFAMAELSGVGVDNLVFLQKIMATGEIDKEQLVSIVATFVVLRYAAKFIPIQKIVDWVKSKGKTWASGVANKLKSIKPSTQAEFGAIDLPDINSFVESAKIPFARILKSAGSAVNRSIEIARKQIQKKFDAHAKDFGITLGKGKAGFEAFENAIRKHCLKDTTVVMQGTYRGNISVHHLFDPETGLNVMRKENMEFLSGWKLSAEQIENLFRTGNIQ
jgi:hypothetical protein